jgi:hypothetical protein
MRLQWHVLDLSRHGLLQDFRNCCHKAPAIQWSSTLMKRLLTGTQGTQAE